MLVMAGHKIKYCIYRGHTGCLIFLLRDSNWKMESEGVGRVRVSGHKLIQILVTLL